MIALDIAALVLMVPMVLLLLALCVAGAVLVVGCVIEYLLFAYKEKDYLTLFGSIAVTCLVGGCILGNISSEMKLNRKKAEAAAITSGVEAQ